MTVYPNEKSAIFLTVTIVYYLDRNVNSMITTPKITKIIPVARFKVFGVALFANKAAILAQRNVKTIQRIQMSKSGVPPIAKCERAPVRAVNVIINTLVPTAVLSS